MLPFSSEEFDRGGVTHPAIEVSLDDVDDLLGRRYGYDVADDGIIVDELIRCGAPNWLRAAVGTYTLYDSERIGFIGPAWALEASPREPVTREEVAS